MTAPKGLRLSVYTHPRYRACAAGGISETHDELTLVGTVDRTRNPGNNTVTPLPADSRVFEPTDDAPAVVLVQRQVWADRAPTFSIEPAEGLGHWRMAGGSYAATSDSRFGELTRFYGAVSIHDREEES